MKRNQSVKKTQLKLQIILQRPALVKLIKKNLDLVLPNKLNLPCRKQSKDLAKMNEAFVAAVERPWPASLK